MKILAIGSHPDDIELFMFGLLSLYHDQGEQIFLAIVTDGRAGGNKKKNLVEIRKKETIKWPEFTRDPVFLTLKMESYLKIKYLLKF